MNTARTSGVRRLTAATTQRDGALQVAQQIGNGQLAQTAHDAFTAGMDSAMFVASP